MFNAEKIPGLGALIEKIQDSIGGGRVFCAMIKITHDYCFRDFSLCIYYVRGIFCAHTPGFIADTMF